MHSINYVVGFLILLANPGQAQSVVSGLGQYVIGVTTPDSLEEIGFKEEDQSVVKGTLALPCTHIRTFTANRMNITGVQVENLILFFYDNTLFKLSCNCSPDLKAVFLATYGKGSPKPVSRFSLCIRQNEKSLLVWRDIWQNADIIALLTHTNGYNSGCEREEKTSLSIASQRFSALSSDCELKHTDSLDEEFDNVLNEH